MVMSTHRRIQQRNRIFKWLKFEDMCSKGSKEAGIWMHPKGIDTEQHVRTLNELELKPRTGRVANPADVKNMFEQRCAYIQEYGFPIITAETASELYGLLKDQKTVDLGCGAGYLTYCLSRLGCDIIGVDNFSRSYSEYSKGKSFEGSKWHKSAPDRFKDASYTDPSFLATLPDYDVVIMSWPDYLRDYTEVPLRHMKKGQVLIFEGEPQGGCCATDEYFNILKKEFKELEAVSECLNRRHAVWRGVWDEWMVYMKR